MIVEVGFRSFCMPLVSRIDSEDSRFAIFMDSSAVLRKDGSQADVDKRPLLVAG